MDIEIFELERTQSLWDEELLRRIIREEIQAFKAQLNGHDPSILLDLKAVAEHFSLPKSRITQAVKQGDLAYVKVGHYLRFRPLDLQDFITRHAEKKA